VFPARYELNSYIVFRKRLVSKRLRHGICFTKEIRRYFHIPTSNTVTCLLLHTIGGFRKSQRVKKEGPIFDIDLNTDCEVNSTAVFLSKS
jgi:hypothetical protein